jgi:hypothetical protein
LFGQLGLPVVNRIRLSLDDVIQSFPDLIQRRSEIELIQKLLPLLAEAIEQVVQPLTIHPGTSPPECALQRKIEVAVAQDILGDRIHKRVWTEG